MTVVVGHGHLPHKVARLGPLGFPFTAVIAPGKEELWPIHEQLKSFDTNGVLRAEATFTDSANRRWVREFDGQLKRHRRTRVRISPGDEELAAAQLGNYSLDNPMMVAMAFKSLLGDPTAEDRLDSLQWLSTPESVPKWGDYSDAAEGITDLAMASFPVYPAPGIAYVKMPTDLGVSYRVNGPTLMEVSIMTLQYRPDVEGPGWRVHQIGYPAPPDQMPPVPAPDE